ncbi:MAG: hypothetical protein OER82_11715, partial [Nitrosopumilus sp.]|nr:hypothetical protein [Nitrosopumilus sp.]
RLRMWDRNSRSALTKQSFIKAFTFLDGIRSKLGLPEHVVEKSAYLFRKVEQKKLLHGRSNQSVLCAVVYMACRITNTPRTLNDIANAAGIKKKVNLKLFRHSEATRTASFMPESILRKRHGWSLSSRMPAKYAHINQQDVENSILGHYGIVQDDKQVKRVPKICPICKNHNPFDAKTCDNCSKPLDLEKAILLEEESKKEKENIENRMRVLEDEINESKIKEGATKDLIIQLMNDDNFKSMLEDAAKKLDKRKPFVKE